MNLHNNPKLFREIIRSASQQLNINELFIEKDYWVSFVLNQLSKSKYAPQVVF